MLSQPKNILLLKTPKEERIFCAIHESGHAMADHLLGYFITSIVLDKKGNGKVVVCDNLKPLMYISKRATKSWDNLMDIKMKQFVFQNVSGYTSECKYRKIRFAGVPLYDENNNANNDMNKILITMCEANKILMKKRFCEMWLFIQIENTKKIFRRKKVWNGINSLAKHILKNNSRPIKGEKVHKILSKHIEFGKYDNDKIWNF